MKELLRTQLIEWHKAHENDVFDFAKEIHEFCKVDMFSYSSQVTFSLETFLSQIPVQIRFRVVPLQVHA